MTDYEDEIRLIDYLNVLWKRKWFIILPTFFCVVIAGLYSFLLPSQWEVYSIIQPPKYILQNEKGRINQFSIQDPNQIAGQINENSYDNLIAAELNLDMRNFPKLKAEALKETNCIKISIRLNDVEKATLILNSLFTHLKKDLDTSADIFTDEIDSDIKSNEIEKSGIMEEITINKKKLVIVKQSMNEIKKEMDETKKRINLLEKEHLKNLKKENRSEAESLAILLYSNEIQESLKYYNTLNELLNSKKIEGENINLVTEGNEKK